MPRNRDIKTVLKDKKLAPNRQLGQNFLVHKATAEKIVRLAGVTPADMILELGVGFGALTKPIAATAKQVIGLELDSGLVAWHAAEKDLPTNVTLIHQDLLKADFHELAAQTGAKLKILANLPYSVSNPLLFKLIESQASVEWAVLMLQKEVVDRLIAPAGTKEYGILPILMSTCAAVELLMKVGPAQFHPRPKVDSAVVRIRFSPKPERAQLLPPHDHELLRKIVRGAFQQRRKTLLNSLSATEALGLSKENTAALLAAAAIPTAIRPEQLTIEDFVRLANCYADLHHPKTP